MPNKPNTPLPRERLRVSRNRPIHSAEVQGAGPTAAVPFRSMYIPAKLSDKTDSKRRG